MEVVSCEVITHSIQPANLKCSRACGVSNTCSLPKVQQHLQKRRAVSLVPCRHSPATHQLPAASLLNEVLRLMLPPPSLSLKLVPMPESLPRSSSRYSSPTSSSSTSASPPTSA